MWLIVFKLILWDNLIGPKLAGQTTNVAFDAHLAGYAFGFVTICAMLALHLLPRDQFDIVALWRRRWQRHNYRAAMSTPEAQARAQYGRVARPITVDDVRTVDTPAGPTDPVSQLRLQIAESLARNDRDTAATLYEQLLEIDSRQVLSRQQQLDVANQLYTLHRLPQAAAAYEKHLATYGQVIGDEAIHVRLLLGIIYARDLQQYEVAEGHLLQCLSKLDDDRRRQQCVHWLNASAAALGHPMPDTGGQGGPGDQGRTQN
jgi:tetratricopeptide (TPR) repeat protein